MYCTVDANEAGLAAFVHRVPKEYIALIRHIELDMSIMLPRPYHPVAPGLYLHLYSAWHRWAWRDSLENELWWLNKVCKHFARHFTGIQDITAAVVPIYNKHYAKHGKRGVYELDDVRGDMNALTAPLRRVLGLPKLKQLNLKSESSQNMKAFAEALIEGNEKAKEVLRLVTDNGATVPF